MPARSLSQERCRASGAGCELDDRQLAAIVRHMQDLPGEVLFQYVDESGERRPIESADVDAYLQQAAAEDFTSKDFRTWAGTVLAARAR
ncbi:MAG: hypothetical protein A3G81_15115 [Betaproteobacteria bacterium RIFCSPLOWO2_12_FULL_65_14]|nr:MAG: hypothetical protein A3G81_15115 [Betaproteobacteria bacterium RIFCSPLOWO2_12_FULL_65_14]